MRRLLTAAATSSAILAAVAPSAQALDIGNTLNGATKTASDLGGEADPVKDAVVGDKLTKAKGVVKGGADTVKAGEDLIS